MKPLHSQDLPSWITHNIPGCTENLHGRTWPLHFLPITLTKMGQKLRENTQVFRNSTAIMYLYP